jgi:hypothetical protein
MLSLNTAYLSSNAIDSVPLPVNTPSYTAVPHRQLMHQVMSAFTSNGFDIDKPSHQIHKKKPRFVSTFSVTGGGLPKDSALKWMVGAMNSYDMSRSVTLLFGAEIRVCTNGAIYADYRLKTRHTLNVWDRIPDLIDRSVDVFGETICKAQQRNDRLREIVVDDRRMIDAFAMEVARRGLLPETKAVAYADEIHNPSFDYEVKENTLWNIHNAYTHTAKGMEAGDFARRVIQFDKLLDETFVTA